MTLFLWQWINSPSLKAQGVVLNQTPNELESLWYIQFESKKHQADEVTLKLGFDWLYKLRRGDGHWNAEFDSLKDNIDIGTVEPPKPIIIYIKGSPVGEDIKKNKKLTELLYLQEEYKKLNVDYAFRLYGGTAWLAENTGKFFDVSVVFGFIVLSILAVVIIVVVMSLVFYRVLMYFIDFQSIIQKKNEHQKNSS